VVSGLNVATCGEHPLRGVWFKRVILAAGTPKTVMVSRVVSAHCTNPLLVLPTRVIRYCNDGTLLGFVNV
jgi:hypothetical protein